MSTKNLSKRRRQTSTNILAGTAAVGIGVTLAPTLLPTIARKVGRISKRELQRDLSKVVGRVSNHPFIKGANKKIKTYYLKRAVKSKEGQQAAAFTKFDMRKTREAAEGFRHPEDVVGSRRLQKKRILKKDLKDIALKEFSKDSLKAGGVVAGATVGNLVRKNNAFTQARKTSKKTSTT